MDDPALVDGSMDHGHAHMEDRESESSPKDAFDTLGIADVHHSVDDAINDLQDDEHDVTSFLRSAGVEVAEEHHDEDVNMGLHDGLMLHMEDHGEHHPHDVMMAEMLHLDGHGIHADDLHQEHAEDHLDPATFDLHQIHQELHDASTTPAHRRETLSENDQIDMQHEESSFPEGFSNASHASLSKTLFDSNMAPSPDDRGFQSEIHLQQEPIPTGVQIMNEEVLLNDIGLSPMGEAMPSTEVLESMNGGEALLAEQEHAHDFDASPHQQDPSATAMLKTPSAGNPPLPIDHALTEPITAFYKLQFLEAPPTQTSGSHGEYRPKEAFSYYMQTLDVTIGRKINRLRKPAPDSMQRRRRFLDREVDASEEKGEPPIVVKEEEEEEKGEFAMAFREKSTNTKNNEGDDSAEDGKRSAPPEVPPAKEIAKPPISEDSPDRGLGMGTARDDDVLPAGEGGERSLIIKKEERHEVITGVDGNHGDDENERQVDVDLGALKSVSRLHARIGYSYTLSQFYLDVLGRNGAWVDDVFKVKGSRVALGPYTKIQISTRTFYFILPPASIASYPIPFNQNAVSGPAESFPFGSNAPKFPSQQAVSDNENELHYLFQQPATFNAFSTNREEWEDERMGLFGMGKGMGKNGAYGYRPRHRKGRKCRKCKVHEAEHRGEADEGVADHSFSGSDNDNEDESDGSVCSCSRCASEKQWMSSSSIASGAEDSSELSSVSSSEESSSASDEGESDEEEDEGDESQVVGDEESKAKLEENSISSEQVKVEDKLPEQVAADKEEAIADDKGTAIPLASTVETRDLSESVMAASDDESEEETLASKLKVAELLKPTSHPAPHMDDIPSPTTFHDHGPSAMQLEDHSHFPPSEADILAVQDLIASTLTPTDEEAAPLHIQPSGLSYESSLFPSLDSSHLHAEVELPAPPIPEIKLTKAEKSALAARIREAKAAARKEEQERKKAEKLAQREKEKAEKAKAKAEAAAAKAAKKQKAEAAEREKMLARMDNLHSASEDYNMDANGPSYDMSGDGPSFPATSFSPGVRPGMPRPSTSGQAGPPIRPGMPGARPPRPMANGYRPINPAMANGASGPGVRPIRPGLNGMPIRPGVAGVRPGMPGSSIRPGPGSVPPLQAQMRPGMHMRPLPPGVRPVRPGQSMRPMARPIHPPQRPPLQPHINTGSYGGSHDGSHLISPEGTPTRATSVHSQDGLSRSPSLDPYSVKRTSPLLGTDGQPFIGPEPIKPDLTYATIIYRALANVDRGRGTLGQVCDWVANEWEWFRMNPESGWQNSIRHNLSLNKAFLKVPRVPEDDPESKGSVWILDPVHAPELVERERKAAEQKEARAKREAEKGYFAAKPVKPRKPSDGIARRDSDDQARPSPSPATANPAPNSIESILSSLIPPLMVPVNRQLPLMLGAIPPHLKAVDIKIKHLLPEPPYVFDNNTIILNPLVFGRFSKQQLAQMQALPTKSAITVLRTYVLRWLQEKVKKLGPVSIPRIGSPAIRPAGAPGVRPPTPGIAVRPGMTPRPQGFRPGQARPLPPGARPQVARPGMAPRPLPAGTMVRPGMRPGAPGVRPAPRPINGAASGSRPGPTPALDPETLRKITQLAESAIKTNSAQSANAKVLLQYLKQVGSQVNIAIATQILSTGVIPPNAIPARPTTAGVQSFRPANGPRPPLATPRPSASTVLGKRPADAPPSTVPDSADAKRQKV